MSLARLPTELFEAIVYQAFVVRGTRRGLRLRVVNSALLRAASRTKLNRIPETFAHSVAQVLYTCRLIDGWFDLPCRIRPDTLIMSYLAYRVTNEPANGNKLLRCLKRVAIVLQEHRKDSDRRPSSFEAHVRSILPPFSRKLREIFLWKIEVSEADFEKHLFAAAIRANNAALVRRILVKNPQLAERDNPVAKNWMYGCYHQLAARYAGPELMSYLMTFQTPIVHRHLRLAFFNGAARSGRIDELRFVYDFKRQEIPWNFVGHPCGSFEHTELYRAQDTPDLEVLKFIAELRRIYPIESNNSEYAEYSLNRCVEMGRLDTVKLAIELGAHPEGIGGMGHPRNNMPIKRACIRGHTAIVEYLLELGADPEKAMATATDFGHLELVRRLMDIGIAPTNALSSAAAGGYLDIVRLLLNSGVDANETVGIKSPLVGAIAKEHTAMFNLLIERGADIHADGVAEECVRRAKKDGLESMLLLLQAHGVDTEGMTQEDDRTRW